MLKIFKKKNIWIPNSEIPINHRLINKSLTWYGGDQEDIYLKSGNKNYKPEDITYKFNKYGYRSSEFDISGPKMISIGCSIVFGTGLPKNELFSELVADYLCVTNCNLSMPGVSNDYISRILNISVPILQPEFVLVNFTYISRREYLTPSGQLITYHTGMVERDSHSGEILYSCRLLRDLGNSNEDLSNFYKNFSYVSKILQGRKWAFSVVDPRFKSFDGFYDPKIFAGFFNSDGFKARDGLHPGREANEKMALTYKKIFDLIST